MKGIILAGDSGSGLHPLTIAIPKQLLPVYDKPMIYYPLTTLASSGIKEIMVITTSRHSQLFKEYLDDGSSFGVEIVYGIQDKPVGIANALTVAKEFVGDSDICLITGDTVLLGDGILEHIRLAQKAIAKSGSATIFLKNEMDDDQYGKFIYLHPSKEKLIQGKESDRPYKSIVGLYVYPNNALSMVDSVGLSERGRYEITSLNQLYLEKNKLQIIELEKEIAWPDNRTFDTLLLSGMIVKNLRNNGHK